MQCAQAQAQTLTLTELWHHGAVVGDSVSDSEVIRRFSSDSDTRTRKGCFAHIVSFRVISYRMSCRMSLSVETGRCHIGNRDIHDVRYILDTLISSLQKRKSQHYMHNGNTGTIVLDKLQLLYSKYVCTPMHPSTKGHTKTRRNRKQMWSRGVEELGSESESLVSM